MMNLQPNNQGAGSLLPTTRSAPKPQVPTSGLPTPQPAKGQNPWNPSQGTPPPMWNPMQAQPAPGTFQGGSLNGMAVPANPAIQNPFKPGPFPTMQGQPARPPGQANQLNWQQRKMQQMPPGMRQAYNGRPMTGAAPNMSYSPGPPTQRGQPVGSRVNLQRNQFGS